MEGYTDEKLKQLITSYEKAKQRDKAKYQKKKEDPSFVSENRQRASNWYVNNKEKKQQHYINNKQFLNYRSQYYYYKRTNNLDKFKSKYPDRVEYLETHGLSLSTDGNGSST